jgi:GNAT superfamily N-acetyltransferase
MGIDGKKNFNSITMRLATLRDVPELRPLIEESVRGLQRNEYSEGQREGALGHAFGVDTQLIEDQTYYVVEGLEDGRPELVGCGGWSRRKTLFGSDQGPHREAGLLDPAVDAAKIRAIFVRPGWARQGLGTKILRAAEAAAVAAGFRELEMGSTLTGVSLYRREGYVEVERVRVPLPNGEVLEVVRMRKRVG